MRRFLLVLFLMGPLSVIAVEQVQVLGLFAGKAILLVDDQRYTLKAGEATPEGILLVSADSDKAVIEIEGERRQLKLGSQISSHYPEAEKKVVRLYPDNLGMYRGDALINGYSVPFLVDTGATTIAMNSIEATKLGIDYRRVGTPGLGETASGRVQVYWVKLDTVSVGEIRQYNVDAVVIEGEQPSVVLLGQSFLNQLHMKREGALLRLEQSR